MGITLLIVTVGATTEIMENLARGGDSFQYGGAHLCADWRFDTPDGRARWSALDPPDRALPDGLFRVATRRGKQFNSMVQEEVDPLNHAARDAVLMAPEDMRALGLRPGDRVALENAHGRLEGRVAPTAARPGNLQVHWPEGNVLIDPTVRAPGAGVPDYNAVVRVVALAGRDGEEGGEGGDGNEGAPEGGRGAPAAAGSAPRATA